MRLLGAAISEMRFEGSAYVIPVLLSLVEGRANGRLYWQVTTMPTLPPLPGMGRFFYQPEKAREAWHEISGELVPIEEFTEVS